MTFDTWGPIQSFSEAVAALFDWLVCVRRMAAERLFSQE
jgi:hypothetical protein